MDPWKSRAKVPDQDDWTALGKCFELEPSAFFLLLYLRFYTLTRISVYHRIITKIPWFHSWRVVMLRLVPGSFALRYYFCFSILILALYGSWETPTSPSSWVSAS